MRASDYSSGASTGSAAARVVRVLYGQNGSLTVFRLGYIVENSATGSAGYYLVIYIYYTYEII